ncbi:MFS transporter [Herbaspirillum chlorophenolicum]|uniref:MFS transporter n=1 Tax=Herbaspirillum chlorophenolicum TaxID=211589 RepID=UPI00067AB408|nr:MFS transporter [Herbaspirillum chlorophenolicum]
MPSQKLPRSFSNLAWSNLAAQSAEQLSLAAAPLVAVLALNAGPGEVGVLAAIQTLPFLLLSLPLGVVADRMPRRWIMLFGETLRFVSLLALMLMMVASSPNIAALSVLGFIGAVGTVGFSVAAPGMVASMVRREDLAQANSRVELARSAAYAAGPAIAGAIVSWVGTSAVFGLATALSATAIALLLRLSNPPAAPIGKKRNVLHEVAEGAAFVMGSALLRPILATGVIFNVSWFVLQAGYVPYAIHRLQLSPGAVGTTLSCYGVGMLAGAFCTSRIVRRIPLGRAIQLGPVAGVFAIASLAATLLLPSEWLAAICFFLMGAGPMVWTITTTTLRQNMTPDGMLGRVSAVFLTANTGARPLGALLGGLVGATWGESACIVVALAGFLIQAAVILFSEVASLRESDGRLGQRPAP